MGNSENSKKAALGRVLFYDTRLSLNNSVSCGTCHLQDKGFSDGLGLSTGLFNKKTERNTMSLVNLNFQARLFWNNKSENLRNAVLQPVSNHLEMGMEHIDKLPAKLLKYDGYNQLFEEVYGPHVTDNLTAYFIGDALAFFLKSMVSYRSKFDENLANDFTGFTEQEKNGMELFENKANCNKCHTLPQTTLYYSQSHNIGLPGEFNTDIGAGIGEYKTPSLRNIELTGPYMHNGEYNTLMDVLDHYNEGVVYNANLSWWLKSNGKARKLGLTLEEKESLVAFLKTFTDWEYIKDERYSNPFH